MAGTKSSKKTTSSKSKKKEESEESDKSESEDDIGEPESESDDTDYGKGDSEEEEDDDETKESGESTQINEQLKKKIKGHVRKWFDSDDKMREYQIYIKELRNIKKDAEQEVLKLMQKTGKEVFSTSNGDKLRRSVSTTVSPLKEEAIKQTLIESLKNEKAANTITQKIMHGRPTKERVYLKRTGKHKEK